MAPPPWAGSKSRSAGSYGRSTPRSAWSWRTSPIAPSLINSRARTIAGWKRVHIASIAKTRLRRAVSMMSTVPATVAVKVFSTNTAFPRVQGGDGDGVVLRVRRRDVEHIDLVVAQDLSVRPVRAVDPVRVRERLGPIERAAGHRHGAGARRVRKVLDHARGDPSRPDDAPADVTFGTHAGHSSVVLATPDSVVPGLSGGRDARDARGDWTVGPCPRRSTGRSG